MKHEAKPCDQYHTGQSNDSNLFLPVPLQREVIGKELCDQINALLSGLKTNLLGVQHCQVFDQSSIPLLLIQVVVFMMELTPGAWQGPG